MLGLRRFNKTQIDLWQGDITKFAVDLRLQGSMNHSSNPFVGLRFDEKACHVSVPIEQPQQARPFMHALKQLLEQHPDWARRVTFVALREEVYEALQAELFLTFEDESDAKS